MNTTYDMEYEFQMITTALIRAGGDLTICDPSGYSSCSLIFKSHHGMQYLEEYVCPYIDLFTFQQMDSVDAWLLAALARSYPRFQLVLESQLYECRTPEEISSCRIPREEKINEFDISHQVAQLKAAETRVRTAFLRVLFRRGNISMLAPFLECGIDLDERWGDSAPYLREALVAGNLSVAKALLQAGASIHIQNSVDLRHGVVTVNSPLIALLFRWQEYGKRSFTVPESREGNIAAESWILHEILQHPTFYDPDAIFAALEYQSPEWVIKALLEAGCGRVGDNPPTSWRQRLLGSEIILAVGFESPHLPILLSYGLSLEYEDRAGFTALLHALNEGTGSKNFAKVLINAGANVIKRTSSGYTPLELARENLKGPHPRTVTRKRQGSEMTGTEWRRVALEEDQELYDYLLHVVRERRVSYGALITSEYKVRICLS
jgi:ankyrin repeat protein